VEKMVALYRGHSHLNVSQMNVSGDLERPYRVAIA